MMPVFLLYMLHPVYLTFLVLNIIQKKHINIILIKLANYLTQSSRVSLEKLRVAQLVKKLLEFYRATH